MKNITTSAGEQAAPDQVLLERGDRRVDELRVVAGDRERRLPAAASGATCVELGLDALDRPRWCSRRRRAGCRASPPARRPATPPGAAARWCPRRSRRRRCGSACRPPSATMMLLNSLGGVDAAQRPQAGSPTCPARRCRPGSRRSRRRWRRGPARSRARSAFSFSMSTTMWISRARPPPRSTWPTPLTVSMARLTCLSASSVSVRRLIVLRRQDERHDRVGVGIDLLDDRRQHLRRHGRASRRPPSRARRWRRR